MTDSLSGETLPGVSIVVKGTTNGTITNMDGIFTLGVNKGDIVQFSFVGYKAQEVVADGQKIYQSHWLLTMLSWMKLL